MKTDYTFTPIGMAQAERNSAKQISDNLSNLTAERDRLKAVNAELLAALEKCEHEMSEAYRRGLVDSLAPKGEASSFTQAITVARIAIASAK